MMRALAFLTALSLICASGVIAGLRTNRWVPSARVQEASDRLAQLPRSIEGWEGTDMPLDDLAVSMADLAGYVHRKYVHKQTGAAVTLLVCCGKAGPICVHTPQVCYTGAGWEQTTTSAFQTPGVEAAHPAEFSVLEFRHSNNGLPKQMRLFLSWGANGQWSSPKQPRLQFAREPVLFKMYVIREDLKLTDEAGQDPAAGLIKSLMPTLRATLFPGGEA